MKNSEYWKKRFALLEESLNKDALEVYKSVEKQYYKAQTEIEQKIRAWYQRIANNNEVNMAEARKMLTAKELKEFKWNVWEYIDKMEQNEGNGQWVKELENASARFHISRLEALKFEVQMSLETLFGNQLDAVDQMARDVYQKGYYQTAYEVQKGFGVGFNVAAVDQNKLRKIVSKPWAADGRNFSSRIWSNKNKLMHEAHQELTRMCLLGKAPDSAISNLAKSLNTSKHNAGRLIMTEEAYFSSASQGDAYVELGVEQYEILATLDSRTSPLCQSLDGKVFEQKDYQPGVTTPPFHVFCRTTTVPYFEDDFGVIGERAARGADGKTYYVPADITYPEWQKRFVVNGLNATETDSFTPPHKKPKKLESIDMGSREEVLSKLDKYSSSIADSKIENAIVITKSGDVMQCFGTAKAVYPDADLGNALKQAFVTHNHPEAETLYSFSSPDRQLFMDYDLETLVGIDHKYSYKLSRDKEDIDDDDISIFDLYQMSEQEQLECVTHLENIRECKRLGIGYRRVKKNEGRNEEKNT